MNESPHSKTSLILRLGNNRYTLLGTIALIIILFSALSIMSVIKYCALTKSQHYEKELQQEVAIIPSLEQQKTTFTKTNIEDEKKLNKIKQLEQIDQNTPYPVLRELARIIPDAVILKTFKAGQKSIELHGAALTLQDVQKFLSMLNASKLFKTPQLVSVEHAENSKQSYHHEAITFVIKTRSH